MQVGKKQIFLFFFIVSCTSIGEKQNQTPFDHIDDPEVRIVLKRAISYGGGWKRWSDLKSIQYTKRSKLLLENGEIESDVTQYHDYLMTPEFEASISWSTDSIDYQILYSKSSILKFANQVENKTNPTKLKETVMSSLFVLGMPFKLLDVGVNLSYQGTTQFMDSVQADIIHATYDPVDNKNHSTSDLWWFYFEKNSGHFLGSKVFHTPTYALIQNLEFTDEIDLKFPTHRKSYRTDSLGNIKFLRAEFWYSDFEIL